MQVMPSRHTRAVTLDLCPHGVSRRLCKLTRRSFPLVHGVSGNPRVPGGVSNKPTHSIRIAKLKHAQASPGKHVCPSKPPHAQQQAQQAHSCCNELCHVQRCQRCPSVSSPHLPSCAALMVLFVQHFLRAIALLWSWSGRSSDCGWCSCYWGSRAEFGKFN